MSRNYSASRRPRIWLEAEHYHISDVPRVYKPHPEGLPTIARNSLVVGYPGAGKTMILKKLCADLATDPTVWPIYVQIEPWAAKVSGEITYPSGRRQTPRDRELLTCCTILIALGLIERVNKYADFELVRVATGLFPGGAATASGLPNWLETQIAVVRKVLEEGDPLPPEYSSFHTLFEIANAIGEAARSKDRTLVFLVDQVDKTSAVHFGTVASLLRRGEYVVVVASRPCPSAPERAALPTGLVVGNDYSVHWVGSNSRTPAWRDFILQIVRDQEFAEPVTQLVSDQIGPLTSLVGPSARAVLALCILLDARLSLGSEAQQAWADSITSLIEDQEAIAAEAIGAWCEEPRRVISRLRDRAAEARRRVLKAAGPAAIRIRRGTLMDSSNVDALIRVCTREGLFIPPSGVRHGLDGTLEVYETAPLLIAPRDPVALRGFDDEIVEFEVASSELDKWTSRRPRARSRSLKRVFVSFWMTEPRNRGALADRLRKGLLGKAEIITGEEFHGSPQWSPAIRHLIKDADVVVLDVTTPRRDVFCEWGWAIGAKKPVLLCAKDNQAREKNPRWARERQIRLFGSEAEFAALLGQLVQLLDSHPNRITNWIDDPTNASMDYRPSARLVVLLGAGEQWRALEQTCGSSARENGSTFESFLTSQHASEGGGLFAVIKLARRAGSLVLVFDGTDINDLLAAIAGGVFTTTDSVYLSGKKVTRQLIVVNTGGAAAQIIPGLLRSKQGATSVVAEEAHIYLRDHLQRVNQAMASPRRVDRRRRGRQ